jgi:diacylglycerol kinase family enzyme
LRDGRLEVCAFPRVNVASLLRLAPGFVVRRKFSESRVRRLSGARIELTSDAPAAFELDGEWAGHLPATFSMEREKLRVVVP